MDRSLKRKREPGKARGALFAAQVFAGQYNTANGFDDRLYALEEAAAGDRAGYRRYNAASIANRKAWVEVIIARCEIASLKDGFRWDRCGHVPSDYALESYYSYKAAPDYPVRKELNDGCQGSLNRVSAKNPFLRYRYWCIVTPYCPVKKEVQRFLDDPSILITRYEGTHDHPLPVGATALSDGTSMASMILSDGTSSVTQAYRPHHGCYLINSSSHPPNIRSINPDDPSKGIIVDLTSNSDDPPQLPVRDEDQNQAPNILVGGDSKEEVQSNSTTTSTSFSRPHWNYDVFLSFRGEDTRINFTDHLHYALMRVGIRTFRDVEELRRGKTISTELTNAIRRSRISIVIFSKGYASSRWCLDELEQIVHCKNTTGHTLLPIFYKVDPSDVRNQTGTFAEAFAKHKERFQTNMEKVQTWREALIEAANCSGWHLESLANRYESTFIDEIVAQVSSEVKPIGLNVARHPIGLNYRFNQVKDLLNLGPSDVRVVGIYGKGGIGKTTLAKVVYNQICYGFEGSSCLLNIKGISEERNGLVRLQEQLLSDILKTKNLKIDNVDQGNNLIEKRINGKRVLVVLDDVDDLKQLHTLVEKQWFGSGSRIIVTTRDQHLLRQWGVDSEYKVRKLNNWESRRLFSLHAFEKANPEEDYSVLSTEAVAYAGGIPLALVILGSFLKARTVAEWKDQLNKLRRTPGDMFRNILGRSFDLLDRDTKNIFFDIACFFVGMDKEYVIKILDGCNFSPRIGIPILTQRSLITIDRENKLGMHALIQDMGKEIISEESPNLLGKRSRLWFYEDVLRVLHSHTGTETVEGLILKVSKDVHLIETTTFTNMKNLRLLQINFVHLRGSFKHLSKELSWLCWHKCPLKFLPQNFHLENLVVLDMQHSNVKEVWKNNKILNKLKVFNLSNSKYLTKSPDFSQVPQLEILILEGCTKLVEIHESIGGLKNLVLLNLNGCKSLRNLPGSISSLESLKTLDLSDCLEVDKLPEQIGRMKALTELLLDRTAIKQLPPSFGHLNNLKTLLLSGYKEQSSKSWWSLLSSWMSPKSLNRVSLLPASVSGLRCLETLSLIECNLSEDGFPIDFGGLSSLQILDLSRNNFCNLPDCIGRLPKLYTLHLRECTALQSISGLFASVCLLDTSDCTSMERFSISSNHKKGLLFDFRNCHKLTEIEGLENWEIASIHNLAYDFRSHLQYPSTMGDDESRVICLPGSEIPNCFSNPRIGSSILLRVPSISKGKFLRLLVCAVYARFAHDYPVDDEEEYGISSGHGPRVAILNKTRGNFHVLEPTRVPGPLIDGKLHSFLFPKKEDNFILYLTPLIRRTYELEDGRIFNEAVMESGDEIEVGVRLWGQGKVKKCGVHVLVDEPNVM